MCHGSQRRQSSENRARFTFIRNYSRLNQILRPDSTISTYTLSRLAIALIWIYHGLVPKILFKHASELELAAKGPVVFNVETTVVLAGVFEVLIGFVLLLLWRRRWPVVFSLFCFVALLLGSIAMSPELAIQAFNPVTLTLSAIVFCLIQLRESKRGDDLSA